MHLDLNLLAALDALLDTQSVQGAAARIGLSPSAMSRTLTRLREVTGDQLLVRAGRAMVPTPRAVALRRPVTEAHNAARQLLGPAPDAPSLGDRTFVIRGESAATALVGPPLLERLADEAPGATVVFRAEGDESVDEMRLGLVDIDIGAQGELGPEVRSVKLFDDLRVALVARARAPRKVSWDDLARRPHVDVSRRGRRTGPLDALLASRGLRRRVIAVVPDQASAALLVARTECVSLVSAPFAARIATLLPVRACKLPPGLARAPVAMAWHPRFDDDPGHRWLRAALRALAKTIERETRDDARA